MGIDLRTTILRWFLLAYVLELGGDVNSLGDTLPFLTSAAMAASKCLDLYDNEWFTRAQSGFDNGDQDLLKDLVEEVASAIDAYMGSASELGEAS